MYSWCLYDVFRYSIKNVDCDYITFVIKEIHKLIGKQQHQVNILEAV